MVKKYIIQDLVSGKYLRTYYTKKFDEKFGKWINDFVDCTDDTYFKYFLTKSCAKEFVEEFLKNEKEEDRVILKIVTIYKKGYESY